MAAEGIVDAIPESPTFESNDSPTALVDNSAYFRGDANRDGLFDQRDLVAVLQSGKYTTGAEADWTEGDWNSDGVFDEQDLGLALQTGCYLNDACNSSKPLSFAATGGENGHPAAKATAQVTNYSFTGDEWTTILGQTIKTANNKDLIIDVSVVSRLITDTLVKTKGGQNDTESAEAGVQIKVLVDGEPVFPGAVTFASRLQELSATLQGIIEDCEVVDGVIDINDDCLTEESIQLLLDTSSANAFNFVQPDVSSGVHYVEVQAKTTEIVSGPDANAEAIVGPGSVTIEVVRMIKDEDVIVDVG